MRTRSIMGLGALAVVVLALTACNPLPNQPTAPRADGRTRSGTVTFTSTEHGWLEVAITAAPVDDLTFDVFGLDWTRPIVPEGSSCYFRAMDNAGWQDGVSLGYRRIDRIGPDTTFKVQFPVAMDGIRFDARVVDDDGAPVGDLTHAVPDGRFEDVAGPICA